MNFKHYNENIIMDIYNTYVNKPPSYFTKYEKLPLHLNGPEWPWETHDFPRIMSLLDYREWLQKYNLKHFKKVLSTCADPELCYITWDKMVRAEYNSETNENDLHLLDLPEKDFDFVTFAQTLEHLYNPLQALNRLYDHMIPGGYIYTNFPTINIPHMTPYHYSGLTPMGAVMLFLSAGFNIIDVGYWGNFEYIQYIFRTGNWPDWRELIHDGIIKNEPMCQVQAWLLCRK